MTMLKNTIQTPPPVPSFKVKSDAQFKLHSPVSLKLKEWVNFQTTKHIVILSPIRADLVQCHSAGATYNTKVRTARSQELSCYMNLYDTTESGN